jgi:predicted glycosyltransferase
MSKLESPDRLLAKRIALSVNQEKCSVTRQGEAVAEEKTGKPVPPRRRRKIWIDLDNTPHVPFFLPIIEQLRKQGYEVFLTARDSYQVCEMVQFHHLTCKVFGRHWGKHRFFKALGTCWRAIRLLPLIATEKPDLAVAHGSRTLTLCAALLGVPSVSIFDYEFAASTVFFRSKYAFVPELIPDSRLNRKKGVMKYPGLKEDVYASRLRPDESLKNELGLDGAGLVVTVRPPATEAHYHNPEAEVLLDATLNLLIGQPDVRIVLLPRNKRQENLLRKVWGEWIANGKIVIPKAVVDGLNLIWFSDLVISGGGTMNREAAALGVPVYSIFRGRIGAVDRYLADTGRLILLESADDVRTKIRIEPRRQGNQEIQEQRPALDAILAGIVSLVEHQCLPVHR